MELGTVVAIGLALLIGTLYFVNYAPWLLVKLGVLDEDCITTEVKDDDA
jgi:hypothetical protein